MNYYILLYVNNCTYLAELMGELNELKYGNICKIHGTVIDTQYHTKIVIISFSQRYVVVTAVKNSGQHVDK